MGLDGTLYKTLLVLHIMAAIVGFGAVFLNGLYAAETKKRQGPSGRAVLEANIAVSTVAEKLIYAVPLLGILLVLGISYAGLLVYYRGEADLRSFHAHKGMSVFLVDAGTPGRREPTRR